MRLFLFPVDERDVSCYVTEMLAIREQRLRLSVPVLSIIDYVLYALCFCAVASSAQRVVHQRLTWRSCFQIKGNNGSWALWWCSRCLTSACVYYMIEDILNSWLWLLKLSYGLMQLGFFFCAYWQDQRNKETFFVVETRRSLSLTRLNS